MRIPGRPSRICQTDIWAVFIRLLPCTKNNDFWNDKHGSKHTTNAHATDIKIIATICMKVLYQTKNGGIYTIMSVKLVNFVRETYPVQVHLQE